MKKIIPLLVLGIFAFSLCACSSSGPPAPGKSDSEISFIKLEEDSITVEARGVSVDDNIVTISSAGRYSIGGTLNDGQIIVDTKDREPVVLELNGARITNRSGAAIYVRNAQETEIVLAAGTENYVSDGASYIFEDAQSDEPNAAVFSSSNLTIDGKGSLTVKANYNNGIASNDDLRILDGMITVDALNDGIKGKDSIAIRDGVISVDAKGDGLQSDNNKDAEKGSVTLEGGTLKIAAGKDGIQAETIILVSGGSLTIVAGGGSSNSDASNAKGMHAGVDITTKGGSVQIDSAGDAVHSNGTIAIVGGEMVMASGDDAVHADSAVVINGGALDVTKSYEGIEGAAVTVIDGTIHIVSSDDGINVAGGNDNSAADGGVEQANTSGLSNFLEINGGTIFVDAAADGIDVNGSVEINGGVVIVSGPAIRKYPDFALDYDDIFTIHGGFLVAAGGSAIISEPSQLSTQNVALVSLSSPQNAGTIIHIETEDGQDVLTFAPPKAYQSVVLSSTAVKKDVAYIIYLGGSSTGTNMDGLFLDGQYSAGTDVSGSAVLDIFIGQDPENGDG